MTSNVNTSARFPLGEKTCNAPEGGAKQVARAGLYSSDCVNAAPKVREIRSIDGLLRQNVGKQSAWFPSLVVRAQDIRLSEAHVTSFTTGGYLFAEVFSL